MSSVSDFIDWPSCAATVVTGTPRRAARSRPRRKQNRRGRPLRAAFERIAKHRGRNIAKVAVAPRVLTLCYHGLRDGEIRLRGLKTRFRSCFCECGLWEHRRMLLAFVCLAFSAVLRLLVGGRCSEFDKVVELLVLRHQLAVLRRQRPRPLFRAADRAFLAALTRLLPSRRRQGLIVTPQTLLRRHRELVRRTWAGPQRGSGPTACRALCP